MHVGLPKVNDKINPVPFGMLHPLRGSKALHLCTFSFYTPRVAIHLCALHPGCIEKAQGFAAIHHRCIEEDTLATVTLLLCDTPLHPCTLVHLRC